jgi:hypothetical protein
MGQPEHVPLVQVCPAAHTELQVPQLLSSVCGSTHRPLQVMRGLPQVLLQMPPWQRSSGPHWLPQPPQLF